MTDLSAVLFEQAQILDGEVPDDPAAFAAGSTGWSREDWARQVEASRAAARALSTLSL